jgi:hypothetical protein
VDVNRGGDRGVVERFGGEESQRSDLKKYKRSYKSQSDRGHLSPNGLCSRETRSGLPRMTTVCSLAAGSRLRRPSRQVRERYKVTRHEGLFLGAHASGKVP